MIGTALESGLELVGGWLSCAAGLVRRLGGPLAPSAARPPTATDRDQPGKETARRSGAASGPQEEVEGAKYYLGPAGEPVPQVPETVVDRETAELPRSHGRDRIVLLPRDPWWTFTYWEITPTTRVQALRALGVEGEGAREVLRVYDVTFITFTGDNAWLSFDVELPPGAGHWYLNVGRPAASFCVEIGLRTRAGRFLPLARSNVVTTPRSAPSPDTTVRWVDLRQGPDRIVESPGPTPAHLGEPSAGTSPGTEARSSDVHAPPAR